MQLNTTVKGNLHEDRVFAILEKLLADDALFVPGKRSKIFRKKAYYSRDREAEIIFDIAIETYLPGETEYSLLTLFECKDYKTAVPVNDIEEFAGKVNQVGPHNTKAVLIATSNFQRSTQKIAQSQKIALARINPDNEIQWILHRREDTAFNDIETRSNAFLFDEGEQSLAFAAKYNGGIQQSLPDLLLNFGIMDQWTVREDYLAVPFLTWTDIDKLLDRLAIERHFEGEMLNLNSFCEQLSALYEVDFDFSRRLESADHYRILGELSFDPLKISINKDIDDKNRFRFTLAHEIGHLLLHLNLLKPHFSQRLDSDRQIDSGSPFGKQSATRLEAQANMLASQLLLPTRSIVYFVLQHFLQHDIYRGHLFVDWQPCNQHAYFLLINKIQRAFGVSKEVARLRLIKLGLLKDTTDTSIRSLMQHYRSTAFGA